MLRMRSPWWIVAACVCGLVCSGGPINIWTFSVFLVPVADSLHAPPADPPETVPCLLMVDVNNVLHKVIADSRMIREARVKCRGLWISEHVVERHHCFFASLGASVLQALQRFQELPFLLVRHIASHDPLTIGKG